jgi:hypothetical protein
MKLDHFIAEPNGTTSSNSWATYKLNLPANLVERSSGKPIDYNARACIYQIGSSDLYTLLTTGGHPSSNRWHDKVTLEQAKAIATAWAARRYKLENKGE